MPLIRYAFNFNAERDYLIGKCYSTLPDHETRARDKYAGRLIRKFGYDAIAAESVVHLISEVGRRSTEDGIRFAGLVATESSRAFDRPSMRRLLARLGDPRSLGNINMRAHDDFEYWVAEHRKYYGDDKTRTVLNALIISRGQAEEVKEMALKILNKIPKPETTSDTPRP